MSFAHVVFGEVVPKNLAIEKADRLAVIVSPALLVFYRVSEPFVAAIEKSSTAIEPLDRPEREANTAAGIPPKNCDTSSVPAAAKALQEFEQEVLQRVLDLNDYSAREIMVPRTSICRVSIDATLDQVLRLFLDHQYSRMPVYEETTREPDRDCPFQGFDSRLGRTAARPRNEAPAAAVRLRRILRKPLVVPETKPLNQLIDDFRDSQDAHGDRGGRVRNHQRTRDDGRCARTGLRRDRR